MAGIDDDAFNVIRVPDNAASEKEIVVINGDFVAIVRRDSEKHKRLRI